VGTAEACLRSSVKFEVLAGAAVFDCPIANEIGFAINERIAIIVTADGLRMKRFLMFPPVCQM